MKIIIYLLLFIPIFITCQKSLDTTSTTDLKFRYIEDLCCGNLMIMNGETIENYSVSWLDSLTYGVNLEDYISSENLEFGDELLIEYEVLSIPLPDDVEIDCPIICDRNSGIPIRIISLEKL